MLEDVHAVRRLHHLYGYFIDKCMYDEAVDCYDEECEIHFFGGIFRGFAGARRMYCDGFRNRFTDGKNGPVFGFILDHPQMQDVVDVSPDRQTALARFRCMMQAGTHYERNPNPTLDRPAVVGRRSLRERLRQARRRLEDQDAQLPAGMDLHLRERLGLHSAGFRASAQDHLPGGSSGPRRVDGLHAAALARARGASVPLRPSGDRQAHSHSAARVGAPKRLERAAPAWHQARYRRQCNPPVHV